MKRVFGLLGVALLAGAASGSAQQMQGMQHGQGMEPKAAGPLAAALVAAGHSAMMNMPAAADDMPAEKYSFKPSPEQMSFGHIIAHETQSNELLCGALSGTPSTATPPDSTAPKAELVARLRKSFETCMGVVANLKEAELGDSVPLFGGRKVTKARAAIYLAQDWADHYSQAAAYLRANGILPPTARRRRM